ncbi:MAG: CehA/McbA family metallohydrolase [Clostridiales bacterium]|nr:CehA/McbA family metallohydrolase [Clostridiales bacterium]
MKTQTEKIEYAIQKDDERRFRYIPLEIPDNVETIEIKPSYTGDEANSNVTDQAKNVIDFALLDENGDDLGSSGSNMRKIVISSSFASDGYKRRPPHGTWQIIVGCYQVKDSGATAFYDVTYIFKEFRYLKGDIHTHTTNSDGKYTVLHLAQKAKKKGLDFLFITDHNNSTEDLAIPLVEGLTIIEGLELTNYDGHINLLGVKKPYNGSYATVTLAELNEKLGQAKRNGAMRVLNHPFCFMNPIDYNIDDVDYDGIEIWNGPAVAKEMIAAHWWQKKLEGGARIPVVGGSDYHHDYYITDLLASPTTRVRCDCNDKQTILTAIKNGHCVITRSPTSTMIDLRCSGYSVGDTVKVKGSETVEIIVSNMKKKHKLQVFSQKGLIHEYTNKSQKDYVYSTQVVGDGFVRAQVVYEKNFIGKLLHKAVLRTLSAEEAKKPIPELLYAITNPIYFVKS